MKALKAILGSPSLLAVGMDPEKKVAHFYIKTGMGEVKKTVPLSPMLASYMDIVRASLLGGVL